MVKAREAWHAAVHGVTESDMTGRRNKSRCRGWIRNVLPCSASESVQPVFLLEFL